MCPGRTQTWVAERESAQTHKIPRLHSALENGASPVHKPNYKRLPISGLHGSPTLSQFLQAVDRDRQGALPWLSIAVAPGRCGAPGRRDAAL